MPRPLIALDGGPKDKQWYWLDDWQCHVDSVRAQHFPLDHPATAALHYQPTGRYLDNPKPQYGRGEIWRHTPPPATPTTTAPAAAPAPAGPGPACGCGNPLLLRRPGRTRCARCDPTSWQAVVA